MSKFEPRFKPGDIVKDYDCFLVLSYSPSDDFDEYFGDWMEMKVYNFRSGNMSIMTFHTESEFYELCSIFEIFKD